MQSIILIWLTQRFSIKLLGKRFYLTLFDVGFFEPSVMGGGGVRGSESRIKIGVQDQNWSQSFMSWT